MGFIERFKSRNWKMPEGRLERIVESTGITYDFVVQWIRELPLLPYEAKLKREIPDEKEINEWINYLVVQNQVYGLLEGYFRVEFSGVSNIPREKGGILAANHTSIIPWDGFFAYVGVAKHTDRAPYCVGFDLLKNSDILSSIGCLFNERDAVAQLLNNDKLVIIFPEGAHGVAKPWWKRYDVTEKGGFKGKGYLKLALCAKQPIIPIGIAGAASTHICIGDGLPIARKLADFFVEHFPTGITKYGRKLKELVYKTNAMPIVLNLFPLPARIRIHYGKPIQFYERFPDFYLPEYEGLKQRSWKYSRFPLTQKEKKMYDSIEKKLDDMNTEVMGRIRGIMDELR